MRLDNAVMPEITSVTVRLTSLDFLVENMITHIKGV
jgi:hypothetical protein